jgi:hypothetical protein
LGPSKHALPATSPEARDELVALIAQPLATTAKPVRSRSLAAVTDDELFDDE